MRGTLRVIVTRVHGVKGYLWLSGLPEVALLLEVRVLFYSMKDIHYCEVK